jgi:hypothetical protein
LRVLIAVNVVIGYRLDSWGSIPSRSKRFFFMPQHPDKLCGPSSLLSNGYRELFLNQPGCEVDHSTPSCAKVKNSGAIPLLACYVFMA